MNPKLLTAHEIGTDINDLRQNLDAFQNIMKSCSDWISSTTELLSDRMFHRLENEKFDEKLLDVKVFILFICEIYIKIIMYFRMNLIPKEKTLMKLNNWEQIYFLNEIERIKNALRNH